VRDRQWLALRFEEQRPRLEATAYRMLGSRSDADDAVQEAWLRLHRTDAAGLDNLPAWLTTVVARICLDMLRQRASQREQPYGVHLPDPIVQPWPRNDPEHQTALAEAVGQALLVVLDTLSPAERVAFVLHDTLAVPFDIIATLLDRTPAAAKMLASRARRRVQATPTPDTDLARQREVVEAFVAATRSGDFDALVAVLDPDVVLRGTTHPNVSRLVRGAPDVAAQALSFARLSPRVRLVLVNHTAGLVAVHDGRAASVLAFTVSAGRIAAIDVVADPDRLREIDTDLPHGPDMPD
jgi:RNA polymerase sigma-70 factor, ECF subfamily